MQRSTASDMIESLRSDRSLNQIRIKNWVDGQLGISLGTDGAAPAVDNTFTGDFAKATNGEGTAYLTSNGRYVDAGAQAGAQDLINGSTLADAIAGVGGNDGLAGGDGDDLIEGGAGSDYIYGSAAGTVNALKFAGQSQRMPQGH